MSNQPIEAPALEAPVEPDLGRWKVKRTLHYWIIGIVVAILGVFMLAEAMKAENPDEQVLAEQKKQKEKQLAAMNKTDQPPSQEELERSFRKQQKEADERNGMAKLPDSANVPGNLVPTAANIPGPLNLPPLPQGKTRLDAGLPSPESMQNQQQSPEQMQASKREEQVLASPIMAIDNSAKVMALRAAANKPAGSSSYEKAALELETKQQTLAADREQQVNQALRASLAQGGAGGRPQGNARSDVSATQGDRNFLDSMVNERTGINDVVRPMSSRGQFSLMQGSTIPVVLITEIRSDLPGDIKAQTTMDVYDSVYGTALLIPKGSFLVGKYNSEVRVGQEKVMAGFSRIIYPSGASADLGGMKAADMSGASGLGDDVDNHFLKMFGTNFLIAGLAQVFQKNQYDGTNVTVVNSPGTTGQLSNTAGQILADTVRVINERNRTIPPTIYVFRGHKFNVMVNKDMVLPPYQTGTSQ